MIDWLKLRLPLDAVGFLPSGSMLWLGPDGSVDRVKLVGQSVAGSYEGRVSVRACPVTGWLVIDGNPAKFFQGHNVFGSDDIFMLSHALIWRVLPRLGLDAYSCGWLQEMSCSDVEIARVDLTESFDFGCLANARSVIRALAQSATLSHRGRGVLSEGTVYFGKHSRRYALKAYAKGVEIGSPRGRLCATLPDAAKVIEYAQPLVRIETVLRLMELKDRKLSRLSDWRGVDVSALGAEYRSGLVISENAAMSDSALDALPQKLRPIYLSWKSGADMRRHLSVRTFYRHRKALLAYGVDISLIQSNPLQNVVPLVRILEGRPVGVPDWALGTPLYFDRDAKRLA